MKTLLLDRSAWDLVLDTGGNIAVASDPYSLAQDASSAIRLFLGELWYNTTKGVPYWADILGKFPPLSLMKALFVDAAETVPGVASAVVYVASFVDRQFAGQVQIISTSGATSISEFIQTGNVP